MLMNKKKEKDPIKQMVNKRKAFSGGNGNRKMVNGSHARAQIRKAAKALERINPIKEPPFV